MRGKHIVESRGKINFTDFQLFRTVSPGLEKNDTMKSGFNHFPTILINVVLFENFQNYISMY